MRELIIPAEINGRSVAAVEKRMPGIMPVGEERRSIERVVIPETATEIGAEAFRDFESLREIEVPGSVVKIGDWAFSGCRALTDVLLPESLTDLGRGAFFDCRSLVRINLPNSIRKLGDWAFRLCSSLQRVDLPESTTKLGNGVFFGCVSLKEVGLSKSLTKIGGWAFFGCSAFTGLDLRSTTEIGEGAFSGCRSLSRNIVVSASIKPNSFKMLSEQGCFNGSSEIRLSFSRDVPLANYTRMANRLARAWVGKIPVFFSGGEILIPRYRRIDRYEFMNRADLSKVVMCRRPIRREIPDGAFRGSGLEEIEIPRGIAEIGLFAFENCEKLRRVVIPASCERIGYLAFAGCRALEEVVFKGSNDRLVIDSTAFLNCDSLPDAVLKQLNPSGV